MKYSMNDTGKIILASASPRRRELLSQIGIEFEVVVSDREERITSGDPEEICMNLAKEKALDVKEILSRRMEKQTGILRDELLQGDLKYRQGKSSRQGDSFVGQGKPGEHSVTAGGDPLSAGQYTVIGADTIVVLDGQILGKPRDEEHAAGMLRALSGRKHQVYTGVCVISGVDVRTFAVKTDVYVAPYTDADIRDYIATGEPMDKAGAYGIQGYFAKYIEKIDGDYYNVVGLPIGRLWREYLSR